MKQRRSIREQFEKRLRQHQPEVERLWESFRREGEAAGANVEQLERLERRMTWGLWSVALHEAAVLFDEIAAEDPPPHMAAPWLCQSCKRRVLRVVGGADELPVAG
jgi:hypothetical protein